MMVVANPLFALPVLFAISAAGAQTATVRKRVKTPEASGAQQANPRFHAPVRLTAAGQPIAVEEPGFAAPSWFDADGDGRKDLVVGQFNDGKMKVYRQQENGELAAGVWLQADGAAAHVPGVW